MSQQNTRTKSWSWVSLGMLLCALALLGGYVYLSNTQAPDALSLGEAGDNPTQDVSPALTGQDEQAGAQQEPDPPNAEPVPQTEPTSVSGKITGVEALGARFSVSVQANNQFSARQETLKPRSAPVQKDGSFEIEGLQPGPVSFFLESQAQTVTVGEGRVQTIPPVRRRVANLDLKPGVNTLEIKLASSVVADSFAITVKVDDTPFMGLNVFARSLDAQREILAKGAAPESASATKDVLVAVTDAGGIATFDSFFPGSWTFLVRSPEGTWSWIYPEFVNTNDFTGDNGLIFDIKTHSGELSVVNQENQTPLPNTELHFYSNFSEPGFRLTTNAEGKILTRLPAAIYYVEPYPRTLKNPTKVEWQAINLNQFDISLAPKTE